jgi:predicted small secreted protein
MSLIRIRLTTTATRLVPIGLALFSILVAACNNGAGSGY